MYFMCHFLRNMYLMLIMSFIESDSGGEGKHFSGASGAYTGPKKQAALESSHRACKSSVDLVRS
jgi:hypothetical protein